MSYSLNMEKVPGYTVRMKKLGFIFAISVIFLGSCNDGAVEVEITVKNYGCNDNESLATKKPSFEFTLTEKKGECDANCILYVDTIDHLHNRKKHMGSVDVFKDGFQLYVRHKLENCRKMPEMDGNNQKMTRHCWKMIGNCKKTFFINNA